MPTISNSSLKDRRFIQTAEKDVVRQRNKGKKGMYKSETSIKRKVLAEGNEIKKLKTL